MRSRLSKNLERKTEAKLILTIIFVVVFFFVFFKFIFPFLIISGNSINKTSNDVVVVKNKDFLASPTLNSQMIATNSASVSITGNALPKETIQLYVKSSLVDTTNTKDDGSFIFKNVSLDSGENLIKVKAKNNNKESEFSQTISITYKNILPALSIDAPTDNQKVSDPTFLVRGKTDPDVKVTVNDFWAVTDSYGNYSYSLSLQNGDNTVKVTAVDLAGNKIEKTVKLVYSPQ